MTNSCNCVGALTEAEAKLIVQVREQNKSNRQKAKEALWKFCEKIRPYEQFGELTVNELIEAMHTRTVEILPYKLSERYEWDD